MKKISVLIPVYNHENKLPRFLKSLHIQQYPNIEYIAVDDGSIDNSLNILNEYAKSKSNFKVIHQKNQGITSAKKAAISHADGEYVAVLESDDYISPYYFDNLVNQMEKTNTNTCNPRYAVQLEDTPISKIKFYSAKQPTEGFDLIKQKNILLKINVTHIKLYKREFLNFTDRNFVINEDLCMTYYNAALARHISFSNDAIYHYIQTKSGLVNQELSGYGIKKIKNFVYPLEELNNNFKKANLLNEYKDEVEAIFIKNYIEHISDVILRTKKSDEKYDMISIIISILNQYYPNWRNNKYYKDNFKEIELTDYFRTLIFNSYEKLSGTDLIDRPVEELLIDYETISNQYNQSHQKVYKK